MYVFNEDDFGNNIFNSNRRKNLPHVLLSDSETGFDLDERFLKVVNRYKYNDNTFIRILKSYSLLFFHLFEKFEMQNIKNIRSEIVIKGSNTVYPEPDVPHAVWPYGVQGEIDEIFTLVLEKWYEQLVNINCGMAVLYLPKNKENLDAVLQNEQCAKGYLRVLCRKNNIDFIDTTRKLDELNLKTPVFDENEELTEAAHEEIARIFNRWIEKKLKHK